MKNIVISLKTAVARREHIVKEFGKQNIGFEFFDALTADLARPLAEKMQLNIHDDFLSPGELACFMSHVSIWQKMVDEQIPHLAIFEDDILLGENSSEFLSSSNWLKEDWNIVKIEMFNKKVLLSKKDDSFSNHHRRELRQLLSKHYGCAGYILSLKAANELIAYIIKNKRLIPLDHIVFEYFLPISTGKILQLNPAICIQDSILRGNHKNFPSDLEEMRRKRMREEKVKGVGKLIKEFARVFRQVKLKLFGFDMGFK